MPDREDGVARGRLLVVGAVAAIGLLAAACGGSGGPGVAGLGGASTTTTTTAPAVGGGPSAGNSGGGSPTAQRHSTLGIGGASVQFSQCIREHGFPNFPDPNAEGVVQVQGIDPGSAKFQAAQQACAQYSPNGGKPPSPAELQQREAQALAFSKCMRSHGISNFPDPVISAHGISISLRGSPGSDLNPNDPQFQAAQKACAQYQPGLAQGVGSSGPAKK